ncbi:hypothetical protein HQN64_05060 [Enterobacteriaceae bacterium BIT-l23]|uniref:Ig-like domain-containing protein n=1 Tax=Jejubacter sp. L23 TaxID=3092086 RepID=UPI001584C83E|nr:hypothetical protein [Enterobacteriaceae bacterium BIT-l23]
MNSTPLNIMVVNGNEIISSSELPPQGQAIYIKAAKGQKYLITQGKDGAAPEHITVKRVGDDLQVFTQEGAEQPDLIIEDFYTQQGELAGMAEDGTYHTYAAAGDGEAFSMLEDGASATLLLSNTATTGLVGLGAAGGLLAGMSAGMLAAGALAAVAAITGVAVAVKNSNDKGSDHHDNTPPQPGDLSIRDGNGKDMSQGGDFNTSPLVFSGTGRPGDTAIVYDGDKPIAEAIIGEDGKWTIPVTLPEDGQQHDLSVGFKDPQGNEGPRTEPVGVGYDTTPPATPDPADMTIVDGDGKDLSAGGDSKSNPIDFRGENATPGNTVIVYDGDKPIGSAIVGEDGRWHIPVTLPEDGQKHDLSVGIKDPAGNESERTPPVGVGYDGTQPEMVGDLTIRDGNGKDMGLGGDTNKNPIDFSGTAEPGSTVIVYDGDKPVGSAIVGEDGKWYIPVTLPEDGQKHDLSVGVKDPAGNESERTPPVGIGYDATQPEMVGDLTIRDGNGKDMGLGGDTNKNPIDFSGTAEPGSTVIVYDGDKPVGSAIVGEDGKWHIPVTLPEDGQKHDLSVGVKDPAGNESERTPEVGIGYDKQPPTAPNPADMTVTDGAGQDLSAGGNSKTNPIDFRGENATPGDTVIVYDGDKPVGSAVVGEDGRWHVPVELENDGKHDLSVGFKDPAGNESDPSPVYDVGFYENPPAAPNPDDIAIVDDKGRDLSQGGDTNTNPVRFSGSGARPGDKVIVYDGTTPLGEAVVDKDGNWTVPVTLPNEQNYDLSVGFKDPMDTEGPTTPPVTIGYDITQPSAPTNIVISDGSQDLSSGGLTNKHELVFSGTAEKEGDVVIIYNGTIPIASVVAGSGGVWSTPVNLKDDATYDLKVGYTDSATNETIQPVPVSIELDTEALAPSDVTLDFSTGTPVLSGAAGSVEAEADVTIYQNGVPVDTVKANADGSWQWEPDSALDVGSYNFSASQTDNAGNTSVQTASLAYNQLSAGWDFSDKNNLGWDLGGGYAKDPGNNYWISGNMYLGTGIDSDPKGEVLYREMELVKGHIYTFSFESWGAGSNLAQLGLMVGSDIVLNSEVLPGGNVHKTYTVTFTATEDGQSRFSIFNDTASVTGNDFNISNIKLVDNSLSSAGVLTGINNVTDEDFTQTGHELLLNHDEAVLDLSKVADQVQDVNSVSLEGHGANTLNISINDVLTLGKEDLYFQDGSKQLMINGDKEDIVNLESINGDKGIESWNALGEVNVNGTVYNVYQSDSHDVELLIQQGIQIQQQ